MKNSLRLGLVLFSLILSAPAFAYHDTDCAAKVWMDMGLFRKYDIKYSTMDFITLRTSSEENFLKVSTKSYTQESTMSLDPGVSTTGRSVSSTQYSSSFGPCAMWANNEHWMQRETYVAENLGSIRTDVAKGKGEYIESIAYMSGCPASSKESFARLLHEHYDKLFSNSEGWRFSSEVDQLLSTDSGLRDVCADLPD